MRSIPYVPAFATTPERMAVTSGADVCIFDLEDSVPLARVAEARDTVRGALHELAGRIRIWVRVHPAASPEMTGDLAALPLDKADGVMLPKVGGAHDLRACRTALLAVKGRADLPADRKPARPPLGYPV